MNVDPEQRARALAMTAIEELDRRGWQLVCAESCTGGLVAAALTGVSGASNHVCGSFVTYQERAKTAWLGVPESLLDEHTAVSAEATEAMARLALDSAPFADVALAITGHLEPPDQSARPHCYVAVARRDSSRDEWQGRAARFILSTEDRQQRQWESVSIALQQLLESMA